MGGGAQKDDDEMITAINVTPLVDVVLVLLVIMMVSATYIVSQSLKVDLPKTSTSDEAVTTVAAVTITREREIYFNNEKVDEGALSGKLKEAKARGAEVNLVVSADQEVQHGLVVHVIDLAKIEAGRIELNLQAQDPAQLATELAGIHRAHGNDTFTWADNDFQVFPLDTTMTDQTVTSVITPPASGDAFEITTRF